MSHVIKRSNGDLALAVDNGATVTKNIKATGGRVFGFEVINANVAARFFQLFNTATVPTTGVTVPTLSFQVNLSAGLERGWDFFGPEGFPFVAGIAYGWSTTKDVYTQATAADGTTQIIFQ